MAGDSVPVHCIFRSLFLRYGKTRLVVFPSTNKLTPVFACALTQIWQVGASLFIAKFLTNFLWSKGYDPDTYAMPVHSAMMDLTGQLLLVACYELVNAIGGNVRTAQNSLPAK